MAHAEELEFIEQLPEVAVLAAHEELSTGLIDKARGLFGHVVRKAAPVIASGSFLIGSPLVAQAEEHSTDIVSDDTATVPEETAAPQEEITKAGPNSRTPVYIGKQGTAIVNLTVTETNGPGYFQWLNKGSVVGSYSNLNASIKNETVAGLGFFKPDANGWGEVYSQNGAHIVVDVNGEIAPGKFDDIPDQRIFDNRSIPANTVSVFHGRPNSSAVVSLVATEVRQNGFVQVLGSANEKPGQYSHLNATVGYTTAKLSVIKFDNNGEAFVYNQGATGIVADVQGYFAEGSIDDVADVRLIDTRSLGGQLPAGHMTEIYGRPNSVGIVSLLAVDSLSPGFIQVVSPGAQIGSSSNVNAEPGIVKGNLAFIAFDESGKAVIYNQNPTHLVADLLAYTTEGTYIAQTPERTLDTREELPAPPFELPAQPSCDKVAWYEVDESGQRRFAVYDETSGAVTRYNTQENKDFTSDLEIDPSNCTTPTVVFSRIDSQTSQERVFQMDLNSGLVTMIPTVNTPSFDPEPAMTRLYYEAPRLGDGRVIIYTTASEIWGSGSFSYSASDNSTLFSNITDLPNNNPGDAQVNVARRDNNNFNMQERYNHRFNINGSERFRNVEVSSNGERAYIMRSVDGGTTYSLNIMRRHPTDIVPGIGLPEIKFEPVNLPGGIQANDIQSYRAIGTSTIVALLGASGISPQKMVAINLATGTVKDLTTNGQAQVIYLNE